ncbi:hypothetical protein EBU24_05670 [bacterium]|nr:hypothetical protein [bacterium]
MKNFKKYLVLALCFGLVLSSLNAAEKVAHLSQFIKMGKDASIAQDNQTKDLALRQALNLVDDVRQYYINNGNPVSFGGIALRFQEAFGQTIEEARAGGRAVDLARERDRLASQRDRLEQDLILEARNRQDLQFRLDDTEENRRVIQNRLYQEQREKQRQQQDIARINEEGRQTRLKLARLQVEMGKREQMAQRQAQENQNVASSSTDDLNTNLQAEHAELSDMVGTLQEEQEATLQQLQACQAKNEELLNALTLPANKAQEKAHNTRLRNITLETIIRALLKNEELIDANAKAELDAIKTALNLR